MSFLGFQSSASQRISHNIIVTWVAGRMGLLGTPKPTALLQGDMLSQAGWLHECTTDAGCMHYLHMMRLAPCNEPTLNPRGATV